MTRPHIIRADTIDLQDPDAPSAKDHTSRTTGALGPHQAETLREVAQESAEDQARSPTQSWTNHGADNDDDISDSDDLAGNVSRKLTTAAMDDASKKQQQQDALAVAQNGGASNSDDGNMDDSDDDLDDDDMMDKISSSPSIEDARLLLVRLAVIIFVGRHTNDDDDDDDDDDDRYGEPHDEWYDKQHTDDYYANDPPGNQYNVEFHSHEQYRDEYCDRRCDDWERYSVNDASHEAKFGLEGVAQHAACRNGEGRKR
ncbi:SH3 domain-containing protein [Colletotrichum higginsianum]|nr:SH3 domain-containing protein [Colletotrichum higginsianum]